MHKLTLLKKQYQKLHYTGKFARIKKKPTIKKYNKSDLIYNSKHRVYEYYNNKSLNSSCSSLESKYPFLVFFYSDLN